MFSTSDLHVNGYSLYLLIVFLFFSTGSMGQESDSLHLKMHQKVVYPDTTIIAEKDMTIPNDSSIVKVKSRWLIRFYYNYMFADTNEVRVLNQIGGRNHFARKTVGDIHIDKIEPFGTSINDTSHHLKNRIINAGNTIHVITQDKTIRNNLMFETGDKLTHNSLDESERILRSLPFILDARVYGIQRKSSPDTVDIYVVTKDVFSININIKPTSNNAAKVALEGVNMFGLGQRFYNNIIIDTRRRIGYEGRYTVYNLYGTFIQGDLSLAFTEDSLLMGISNTREFVTHKIRNAGGLGYHYRVLRYYSRYDESRARTNVADNHIDGWYGRSFPISTRDSIRDGHLNFILSGRSSATWYSQRPIVSADTNLLFQHNSLILSSAGLARYAYAKDILLAGFGVVEDVPLGLLAGVTAGYSVGEFVSRPYAGIHMSNGIQFREGYIFNSVEFGSFFHRKKAEDGALRLKSHYISKLIAKEKLFKGRVLFQSEYIRGINRTSDIEHVELKDLEALSGLNSELIFGNTAFASRVSLSVFSPWYLIGFRLAFFSLADLAYFSNQGDFIFSGRPYWGFSGGIRLNNERFIFGTIDFSITIYPAPPEGANFFSIGLSLNPIFPYPSFRGQKPGVVRYGHSGKLHY